MDTLIPLFRQGLETPVMEGTIVTICPAWRDACDTDEDRYRVVEVLDEARVVITPMFGDWGMFQPLQTVPMASVTPQVAA